MVHVCFALYDKTGLFSKFTGTALVSLFENTNTPPPSITVHIMHDNTLSTENLDKLAFIAGRYGQIIKFYNVEKLCPERIDEINKFCSRVVKGRFTIATFYRFFIPHIFPPELEKVIYLDSDIIVNLDIEELWKFELGDNVLGVVTTHSQKLKLSENEDLYDFNAGVLLINIPLFRREEATLKEGIRFIATASKRTPDDQVILNHCFNRRALQLPVKFNRLVKWDRSQNVTQLKHKIYHYNSHDPKKSIELDMNDTYNRLWMKYFIRTPWFSVDSIGRLYEGFQKICDGLMNTSMRVANIMPSKMRAFFIEPKRLVAMKKHFSIRDDEEIILAEDDKSIDKLINSMKNSDGRKVYFILAGNFVRPNFPFARLTKAGFEENKDFIRAWELLSDKRGVPFGSNPLIHLL